MLWSVSSSTQKLIIFLDKFEILDFDDFLLDYLNKKPKAWIEEDWDTGQQNKIRTGRKDNLDFFTWKFFSILMGKLKQPLLCIL